ncbi:MAG: pitrilysin family protein [Gammaproteobacteria bacterium]
MSINKRVLLLALLFLPLTAAAVPDIQHWQTAAGARVYFVQLKELPIVDVQVAFDAGSARDPNGGEGLAMLTNSLLDEGAGGMDANAVSFEFERLGAQYSADAGYDSGSVSLRSLSDADKLRPALDNLSRVLGEPDFPEEALARQKKRLLVAIQRKQQSPGAVADDAFQSAVYGDHPYASPKEGTADSVRDLQRSDVSAFHDRYYVAANAVVTIVGDLDRRRAEEVADRITQALDTGAAPAPLPEVAGLDAAKTLEVDHPSAQTHILLGQPGIERGDTDYFSLYVGNHVLGGSGLVSRLFKEIRGERGLAYSTYSYFFPRRRSGPFTAAVQTRADQADEALRVLRDNIRRYIQEGPSEKELMAAKKNITGGFPLRIDSNSDILGYVAMIGFYGLPLDYLDTFKDRVEAVTVEQIREAFRRRLDPDHMITVKVGPLNTGDTEK